jgi:hypothetical protein
MQPRFQTYRLAYQLSKASYLGTEYKTRKVKSKVEICKLPSTTLVFLPRYREVLKLPPSPRWSPSQGIPRKRQAPGRVTPWIAPVLPHAQVSLWCAFSQAYPRPLPPSSLSSFRLNRRRPCSLRYTVATTPQARLVWFHKTTGPADVQARCTQAPLDERYVNLTSN